VLSSALAPNKGVFLPGGALVPIAAGILQPSTAADIKTNIQVNFQRFSDVCRV